MGLWVVVELPILAYSNAMTSYLKKGLAKAQDAVHRAAFGKEIPTTIDAFFKIVDKDMKGNEVPMSNYKGSVLAVVNVATK